MGNSRLEDKTEKISQKVEGRRGKKKMKKYKRNSFVFFLILADKEKKDNLNNRSFNFILFLNFT